MSTREFFREVKACLRFFGTRTCRRSLKIQAVLLALEKSQQYAVTIHSVRQREVVKEFARLGVFTIGANALGIHEYNLEILIRRISDHQLVRGFEVVEQ